MICYYIVLIIIITYFVDTVIGAGNMRMNGVYIYMVSSIKELCIIILNAIIMVTIFSHSKIGTYDLRVKQIFKTAAV